MRRRWRASRERNAHGAKGEKMFYIRCGEPGKGLSAEYAKPGKKGYRRRFGTQDPRPERVSSEPSRLQKLYLVVGPAALRPDRQKKRLPRRIL